VLFRSEEGADVTKSETHHRSYKERAHSFQHTMDKTVKVIKKF